MESYWVTQLSNNFQVGIHRHMIFLAVESFLTCRNNSNLLRIFQCKSLELNIGKHNLLDNLSKM